MPSLPFPRLAMLFAAGLAAWPLPAAKPDGWKPVVAGTLKMAGDPVTAPIALDGRVVATTNDGAVWGIDPVSSARVWGRHLGEPIAWLAGSETEALVIAVSGRLTALRADGTDAWQGSFGGPCAAAPWLGRGIFLAARTDGRVSAISAADGGSVWTFGLEAGPIRAAAFLNGAIAVSGPGTVIGIVDDRGRLIASGGPTAENLTYAGGRLIVGGGDGYLEALDPESLRSRWRRRLGAPLAAAPAADGRRIYAVSRNGVLFVLDARSGSLLWWRPLPSTAAFRPLFWGGAVVVASRSSLILAFDPGSGEPVGRFDVGAEVRAQPVVAAGRLCLIVPERWIFLSLPGPSTAGSTPSEEPRHES